MARVFDGTSRRRGVGDALTHRSVSGLVALVLLGACRGSGPPPAPAADEMHVQFQAIRELRRAAIQGDVTTMWAVATQVSERGSVKLSQDLQPILYDLRRQARVLQRATTLDDALRAATGLAETCGRCHERTGVGLGERFVLRVPREGGHAERMSWAMDRLWEGLIGPSDGAWEAGARAVPDDDALGPDLAEMLQNPADLDRARARLAALSRMALETDVPRERADLTGEVLSTCASCHLSTAP